MGRAAPRAQGVQTGEVEPPGEPGEVAEDCQAPPWPFNAGSDATPSVSSPKTPP